MRRRARSTTARCCAATITHMPRCEREATEHTGQKRDDTFCSLHRRLEPGLRGDTASTAGRGRASSAGSHMPSRAGCMHHMHRVLHRLDGAVASADPGGGGYGRGPQLALNRVRGLGSRGVVSGGIDTAVRSVEWFQGELVGASTASSNLRVGTRIRACRRPQPTRPKPIEIAHRRGGSGTVPNAEPPYCTISACMHGEDAWRHHESGRAGEQPRLTHGKPGRHACGTASTIAQARSHAVLDERSQEWGIAWYTRMVHTHGTHAYTQP